MTAGTGACQSLFTYYRPSVLACFTKVPLLLDLDGEKPKENNECAYRLLAMSDDTESGFSPSTATTTFSSLTSRTGMMTKMDDLERHEGTKSSHEQQRRL